MFSRLQLLLMLEAFLMVGTAVGLLAILAALLQRRKVANYVGAFGFLAGLFGAWQLGPHLLAITTPAILLIVLIPAGLGALALLLARFYQDRPRLKRFQLSVPWLLYLTLVVACIAGGWSFSKSVYYHERDLYLANFQRMPGIDDVAVRGSDVYGLYFVVEDIKFSLTGRPDTRVRIAATEELIHCKSSEALPMLAIQQIGPWQLRAQWNETFTLDDGEVIEFPIEAHAFPFRSAANFREEVPLEIDRIDDIVAHYDELVELLATWPHYESPGRLEQGEKSLEYWVQDNRELSPSD